MPTNFRDGNVEDLEFRGNDSYDSHTLRRELTVTKPPPPLIHPLFEDLLIFNLVLRLLNTSQLHLQ